MMLSLYHIVPKDDGCHFLARGLTGNHFLIRKDSKETEWKGELTFDTEDEAQEYINNNNLEGYVPEEFWRNKKYHEKIKNITPKLDILPILHCPDCGHTLRWMCAVGADESVSGYAETLYHCTNDECMSDFEVTRFSDGKFIKMTRHFWG